jgi:sec-independent protein translocase protein TatA
MLRFGELALIVLIVLVIFGAGKLPNVLGDLGRGMRAFKDGLKDDDKPKDKDDTTPPAV